MFMMVPLQFLDHKNSDVLGACVCACVTESTCVLNQQRWSLGFFLLLHCHHVHVVMCALMCTVTHVQPRACNHTCAVMRAVTCVLSHACRRVHSHIRAVTCVQSRVYSRMCAVMYTSSLNKSLLSGTIKWNWSFYHFPPVALKSAIFQETMIRISRECVLGTKILVLGRLTVATPLTTSSPPKGHKRLYLETSLFTDMNLKQKFTPIILIPNQQERVYSPFLHFHICVFFSPTARTPHYLSFYCWVHVS